jgi:hypothetical protein
MMDTLGLLVDKGLSNDALDVILTDLITTDDFDDDDDKRCCIALAWGRSRGNKSDPTDVAVESDEMVSIDGDDYAMLTDEDADQECADYIRESVWSFRPEFLSGETGIDQSVFEALADKCEGANEGIRSIIDGSCGMDSFVDAVTSADGRGPFLSSYDNEEHEYRDDNGDMWYFYQR